MRRKFNQQRASRIVGGVCVLCGMRHAQHNKPALALLQSAFALVLLVLLVRAINHRRPLSLASARPLSLARSILHLAAEHFSPHLLEDHPPHPLLVR